MRLTHVGQLRLPFGRLMSYDVTVSGPRRSLPVSFDQRRHVRGGDRPGSWMALAFHLPDPVPLERLGTVWRAVLDRHAELRTAFWPDAEGAPGLHAVDVLGGEWVEHPIAPGKEVNDALREVLDHTCSPYHHPAHRLCVLEGAAGPTLIVGSDHSHVDMWSLLVILRDFVAILGQENAAGETPSLPVDSAPLAFAEHTRVMREGTEVPEDIAKRWSEILTASGDVMPRFPLALGAPTPQPERVEVRDVFDVDESVAFSSQAKEEGVSTLSLAVAAMTAVTGELADSPLRAVFPVHSRVTEEWYDSVGWFITNSVIESSDPDPRAASAAVREAIRLGSSPLEATLRPWGGMPEAPGMFAISWLDLRRLPVRVDTATLEAQFVGAAIRTDGVMLWFIFDQSGLHLRCRYPDVQQARESVGAWLDLLVERMKDMARLSVRGQISLDGHGYRVNRATRADLPEMMAVLSQDDTAGFQGSEDLGRYEATFDAVGRDRSHHVTVVRDAEGRIVGMMQLIIVPGVSRGGATRLQIEGLWVAESERSQGLGAAMLEWAHDHGRARGATLAHVITGLDGDRARNFYARVGYDTVHSGLVREL